MKEKKMVVSYNTFLVMVVGVVFLVLKLVGVINWAWVWVLAPFWTPIALYFVLVNIWILAVNIINIFER